MEKVYGQILREVNDLRLQIEVFEDNVGKDGLSSQSTYKVNIECPHFKASIAPNPKVLNDLKPSKEQLEKVYGQILKEVNDLRLQIDSKKKILH